VIERLDREFVPAALRLGQACLELRRSGVSIDEEELASVLLLAAPILVAKVEADVGAERGAAWQALGQMGLAASLFLPRLQQLDRETLDLCVFRDPPLAPKAAAELSLRRCNPLAMRQRLYQAWERLGRLLSSAKGPV
jgi:hypothetical protein